MANNDGQIVLGLDIPKTVAQINGDIKKLEKQLEQVKATGALDTSETVKQINSQILALQGKLQEINIQANVDVNNNTAKKAQQSAQQLGQKIGDTVEKSVQQSLSIDDVIDKQVTDLMAKYSIAGKKGSKAFEEIRQAVVNYRKELASVDSAFDSDDIFYIFSNSADIRKVTSALTDHMKVADATKDTYASLAEYIKHVNNSGTKIHLPESIRQEYGDDFSSMRSQLGKAFTTGQGGDFESFITELNGQLGNVIDMSHGAETAFGDLVQKVNSAKGGNFLSGDELFKQGYLDRNEIERDITSAIDIIEEEEKKLAQVSTSTTNTVVQNEQKKQQAYQQTAKAQSSVDNPDLDMSGNAQKIEQFKESLAELGTVDSKYVDKLSDRFGNLGIQIQSINASLSEVAVHEKGEYMGTKEILSSTLKGIDKYGQAITLTEAWDLTNHEFVKSLDAVGSSFDNVQKHVTTYQAKLNDLKTKYSNASLDYSGFETTLANFQKGIGTVDDLKLAFNELENSAKLGVQSLKSQSSSFDPIQQALNNMRDMPSMLKTLEASMSGVKDKTSLAGISVKDLTSKYEELQKEMTANGGKVPLTDQWTQDYRELMSTVTSATKQVDALKKAEASDNSQATKQANYYSSILASYRQMYDIKKKLLSAGEEEAKVLESQRKSLSASIASNYKQLGKQGLTDKDWQSQVDALKKEQEYQLNLTQARISDKNAIQEQTQAQRDYANALREQEALQKNLNKIQLLFDNGHGDSTYGNRIKQIENDFVKYGLSVDEASQKTQTLRNILNGFKDTDGNFLPDDKLVAQANKLETEFKAVKVSVDSAKLSYDKFLQPVSSDKASSLIIRINDFLTKNTAITKEAKEELLGFIRLLQNGNVNLSDWNKFDTRLKEINQEMRVAGKLGKSLKQTLIDGAKSFAQWTLSSGAVMEVWNGFKQGIRNVKELDDSLVELNKVTDLTVESLSKVTEESFELGEKLAKTGTKVLDSVTSFSRAGYNIEDSMKYAEEALKTTNISENLKDAGQAADSLVNIMKGFQDETPEFAKKINDSVNQVSNTEAVDFDNLIDGATRLSAVADQAGMSFEQMLGTLTGAYEVLGNMEKVANGQITIFTRLQAIQMEGEEEVSTVAKLQDKFSNATNGAVNIVDKTTGQLRNVYDILDDLSDVWDTLDKNTQEALAFEAAGTRQKNVFLSMMQNWQGVEDAVKSAENSIGSADEENQAYLNSLSGKLEDLESALQHISKTLIDSNLLKFFVDLGTTGVKSIDGLISILGGMDGVLGASGGIALNKMLG